MFLSGLDAVSGEYYTIEFKNNAYLGFDKVVSFANSPYQGASYDSSLGLYWNMNEGFGSKVVDLNDGTNNGTIYGGTWVTGEYGQAIYLNGSNSSYIVSSKNSNSSNSGSFSLWVKPDGIPERLVSNCWIL